MIARWTPLVLLCLLAGCSSPEPGAPRDATLPAIDPGLGFLPAAQALVACAGGAACYEPSVAVDAAGRVLVSDVGGQLAVSEDGGRSFFAIGSPPLPSSALPGSGHGDALLQADAKGRVYFVSILSRLGMQGINVAATDDGGKTWSPNVLVSLVSTPPRLTPNVVDRPWLGFAPDGAVYLSYANVPTGVWIARSDDGGASFGQFVPAALAAQGLNVGHAGPPIVDADGTVLLPVFSQATADASDASSALLVARSTDRGASFEIVRALQPAAALNFPIGAFQGASHAVVALADPVRGALVVRSSDGGRSWSQPETWSAEGETATASAWPLARADGLDVAYYAPGGASDALVLARGDGGDVTRATVAPAIAHGAATCPCNTDFAHAARLPDGRVVVAWADADRGVLVGIERS